MTFNLQAFSRLSSNANNAVVSLQDGSLSGAPTMYSYISATDNLATITAADYFATQAPIFNLMDLIYCVGTDGEEFATVTTITVDPNSVLVTLATPATGNVTGPASSFQYQPTIFADATGKLIEGEVWIDQAASPAAVVPGGLYFADLGSLLTFNMPATFPKGARLSIVGVGSGGFLLRMNTGQTAHMGSSATTSAGSLASTNRYDVIHLVCTVANTTFSVIGSMGNITVA